MNIPSGSYRFDTLDASSRDQEIARFKRQVPIFLSLEQEVWQQIGLTAGMQVLDIGCGAGAMTCEIAKVTHVNSIYSGSVNSGSVIGIDVSPTMLQKAQLLKDYEQIENIQFQRGSIYELDFPAATFDVVYSRFLFQHLEDPIAALQNIDRVLKPGGYLCIIDVDDDWFIFHPEPTSLSLFRQKMIAAQQAQGGDPYVGRKLGGYLSQVGFTPVRSQVKVIDSDQVGFKALLDLLSFGVPYQSTQQDFATIATTAQKDTYSLLALPYQWAGFGIFAVTGRKPQKISPPED